jgi:hypothetical protein
MAVLGVETVGFVIAGLRTTMVLADVPTVDAKPTTIGCAEGTVAEFASILAPLLELTAQVVGCTLSQVPLAHLKANSHGPAAGAFDAHANRTMAVKLLKNFIAF